jgi:hypothetical protein
MKNSKKIFTISVIAALCVFIALSTSCKKKTTTASTPTTTSTGSNPTPQGTLTATWNDTYTGKQGTISETQVKGNIINGTYFLNSYTSATNTATIAFQALSIAGTGTVTLDNGIHGIGILYETASSSGDVETGFPTSNPGVGTLTVTAFSTSSGTTTISGTYTFTGGPNNSSNPYGTTVTAPSGTVSGSFTGVPFH